MFVIKDGELKHADADELYHWKYTRRERKNGKWVYFYDDVVKNTQKGFQRAREAATGTANKTNGVGVAQKAFKSIYNKARESAGTANKPDIVGNTQKAFKSAVNNSKGTANKPDIVGNTQKAVKSAMNNSKQKAFKSAVDKAMNLITNKKTYKLTDLYKRLGLRGK